MLDHDGSDTSAFYCMLTLHVDAGLRLRRVEGIDLTDYDAPAPLRYLFCILCSDSTRLHYLPISRGVATTSAST